MAFVVTQHEITLARAKAMIDSDHLTVALCDVALGRQLNQSTLDGLEPGDRWRLTWMPAGEARDELSRNRRAK